MCTVSIATYNKLIEIVMSYNGDNVRPRLLVKVGNRTFSWLFDTGTAEPAWKKYSFQMAKWKQAKENFKSQTHKIVSRLLEIKCPHWAYLKWIYGSKAKSSHTQSMSLTKWMIISLELILFMHIK